MGGSGLNGVVGKVKAIMRKCSDHELMSPVSSTKRHLMT